MKNSFKNLYLDEDEAGTFGGAAARAFGGAAAGKSEGATAGTSRGAAGTSRGVICNYNLYLFSVRLKTFEHV